MKLKNVNILWDASTGEVAVVPFPEPYKHEYDRLPSSSGGCWGHVQ